MHTDHSAQIARLRLQACEAYLARDEVRGDTLLTAASLLQCHDDTGISLDSWVAPRAFVENLIGEPIQENGC